MRKIVGERLLSLVLMSTLALAGCGNSSIDDYATNDGYSNALSSQLDNSASDASEYGKTVDTASKGIAKEDVKVGVLHYGDPADGSGYSYTHDLGIQGMQTNLGLNDNQIYREINVDDSDTDAIRNAIQNCIDEGCNIIITTSWGYMDVTEEMAEEHPDIYFAHATGYKSNGTNFTNYFGRIYQPRYLSGIVAGMNTTTDKIGYVAAQGTSSSEVTGGIDAFAIGVYEVNPEAVVYVKVTNSWYDPEAEEAATEELLDMGCDVMAQHCDTSYPQTLAQERGVYGIGYNSDMSMETPDSCLTSVIWNWSAYYTELVQSIIDGTYDGSNYYGGVAEGLVGITSLASFCADGTQEKVDEAYKRIVSGEFNIFDGVLETNDGNTVGSEGSTLDDSVITGGIDWYYKNVVVVE
jgi:basic membrane protein A